MFNSPDGGVNPFWAKVDCLSQGYPKGFQRTAGPNPAYMLLLLRSEKKALFDSHLIKKLSLW